MKQPMLHPPYTMIFANRLRRSVGLALLIAIAASLGFAPAPGYAFNAVEVKYVASFLRDTKLLKRSLPNEKILDLAKLAEKSGGTKEIGTIVGKLNLPNEALEDTFARILVAQGRVSRSEAEGWMQRLGGVPGFRSALSKSMGASPAKTAGHLNEVRLADSAANLNIKVKEIGKRFDDGVKDAPTDIDVLLEHRGREIAVEAKDYLPTTPIPLDTFRADLVSLAEYRRANPNSSVVPVFWITNRSNDQLAWRLLEEAVEKYKVELLVGPADEVIHQIPLLLR